MSPSVVSSWRVRILCCFIPSLAMYHLLDSCCPEPLYCYVLRPHHEFTNFTSFDYRFDLACINALGQYHRCGGAYVSHLRGDSGRARRCWGDQRRRVASSCASTWRAARRASLFIQNKHTYVPANKQTTPHPALLIDRKSVV